MTLKFAPFVFFVVERRLELNEYPLEVQLNWTRDEREGKFVLRNAAHKPIPVHKVGVIRVGNSVTERHSCHFGSRICIVR